MKIPGRGGLEEEDEDEQEEDDEEEEESVVVWNRARIEGGQRQ